MELFQSLNHIQSLYFRLTCSIPYVTLVEVRQLHRIFWHNLNSLTFSLGFTVFMSVRRNFCSADNVNIFLILFRLPTMQCKWTFTKHFTLSTSETKCPMLWKQWQICASLAAMLRFHAFFFSHSIKLRAIPLSADTVSLHYLPKMSAFNSHMRQNANYRNLKLPFEDLFSCYCDATEINSRTSSSQISKSAVADKGADTSETQTHHCMTPEQWIWLLFSVSVIPTNKLSLQELNLLNGIKLLTSNFLEIYGSQSQFPGRDKCPFSQPCGRPWLFSMSSVINVLSFGHAAIVVNL